MSKTQSPSPTVFLVYGLLFMEVIWARANNGGDSRRVANFSVRMFYKDKEGDVEISRINKLCLLSSIDPETQEPCAQISSMYDGYVDRENNVDNRVFSNTFFPGGNSNKKNYTLYREFVVRATNAVKAFIETQAAAYQRTLEARDLQKNSPSPQLQQIKALGAKFLRPAKQDNTRAGQGSD